MLCLGDGWHGGSKDWLSPSATLVQSLANGAAWGWGGEWGFLVLFPRGLKFLTGIPSSLVWELSESAHIRCLAEDLIYIKHSINMCITVLS